VNNPTDQQLLRDFAMHRSDAAFAGLVRRHVDLVYSAALRMVCDAHLAEDVTQGAFVALAQNARQLAERPVLSGWLHRTAQNLAANAVRSEVRRRAREQEAAMNQLLANESDANWENIAPHLDAALGELNEAEHDAVLLRYFEKKSAREMAQILGTSEDAAQKRVGRAVEKLREFFSKHKITVGAGGLAVLISANAVQAAPVGLAATISAAAVLAGMAVHTSTLIAATKTIAMITLQKTIVTAALVIVAGAGIYEAKQAHDARNGVAKLQAEQTQLAIENARLQAQANKLSDLLASAKDQKQLTQAQFNELLKLRGQMGVKQANTEVVNDPAFQKAQVWLANEKKIREQFELHPEQKIPEMKFLKEEDWLDHARHADVDTAKGMRIALSNIRAVASGVFAMKFTMALQSYMAANQQQLPATASQVAGYFNPPLQDTDVIFSRYVVPAASDSFFAMNPSMTNMVFVQDKSTIVDAIDQQVAFGQHETVWLPPLQPSQMNSVLPPELEAVAMAYSDANGQGFLSPYDLKPYATTPEQKAVLDKLIQSLNPTR
jgi:RNA polymerase sigma factor (sigma-70 family)